MAVTSRFAAACVCTTLALFAVACGSTSPTAPARGFGFPGEATGVEIDGSVSGMSQGLTAPAAASATSSDAFATTGRPPVTVSIVGTNISTTVDGSGHFHLRDVPVGDVQVKFAADGLDATITLRDIAPGDRIHIRVRVTDRGVRLEAEQRERRDNDDEIKGDVSGLSGTCPDITFTVSGLTVNANATTRYEDGACAAVRNSVRVEVKGQRRADGSVLATRIELED